MVDWQSESDLDSIRNSCDVLCCKWRTSSVIHTSDYFKSANQNQSNLGHQVSKEAPGSVLLGPNMTSTLTVGVKVQHRSMQGTKSTKSQHRTGQLSEPSCFEFLAIIKWDTHLEFYTYTSFTQVPNRAIIGSRHLLTLTAEPSRGSPALLRWRWFLKLQHGN